MTVQLQSKKNDVPSIGCDHEVILCLKLPYVPLSARALRS